MAHYARVTMKTGEVLDPVRVHDDGRGLRFYAAIRGTVRLIGSSYGAKVTSWGERRRLVAGGPRVALPYEISGLLPESIQSFEGLRGCQCGSLVKSYRPPISWEEVPVQ